MIKMLYGLIQFIKQDKRKQLKTCHLKYVKKYFINKKGAKNE